MKGKAVALVIFLMFVMALAAGATLSLLLESHGALPARVLAWFHLTPSPSSPPIVHGTLSVVLDLTPEQSEQMKKVWQDVATVSNECIEDAKTVQIDEDMELRDKILTTDQLKEQFQAMRNKSKARLDALAKKRDMAFQAGIDKTMPLLNQRQRDIYKQILHDRVGNVPDGLGGGSSQVWTAPSALDGDRRIDEGSSHTWHLPDPGPL